MGQVCEGRHAANGEEQVVFPLIHPAAEYLAGDHQREKRSAIVKQIRHIFL